MAETKKRGPGRPPGSKNKNTKSKSSSASLNTATAGRSKQEHIEQLRLEFEKDKRTIDVIWSITLIAIGVFLFCTVVRKSTGALGAKIHDICLGLFGIMGYVLPFLFILAGVLLIMKKLQHINGRTAICGTLIFFQMCILNSYRFINEKSLTYGFADIVKYYKMAVDGEKGGAIGMEIGSIVVKFFGKAGLLIIAIAILIICIFLVANTPISKFFENMHEKRENKKMLAELEAAEKAKVQMAVASTVGKEVDDRHTASIPQEPISYTTRNSINMEDTLVTPINYGSANKTTQPEQGFINKLKRNTIFGSSANKTPADEGKYDSEAVGTAVDNAQDERFTGYGLNGTDYGNSGSYGLDAGYSLDGKSRPARSVQTTTKSTPNAQVATTFQQAAIDIEEKPKRVINNGMEAAGVAAAGVISKASVKSKPATDAETEKMGEELSAALNTQNDDSKYQLPPYTLLKQGSGNKKQMTDIQLEQRADLLEQTLRDFGVEATVLEVTQGASVTRYEVQPATGVKVSSITKLADDIALNLRAKSIRIEAPIPGKAAVGIEVENDKPAPVVVRDLIESPEFEQAESKIAFVVGKDISGKNIIADLKSMPHLLIAGATGSGKSVCINTIIASFLYKAKPSEVKLIMIDPKVVELQAYNDLPHMLVPVVTDPRKASKALAIAVQEMDKRYEAFAKAGVKDLDSYNDLMRADQEYANVKPQIVIIIDELADLMMACSNEVENSICRLAQKARAAGMHLIVATQRPSVDVVTGLIKANIPSRIAFSVSSQIDSRTILDMAGAEKLLGKGDMLFSPVGSNKPYRVQGPFITEAESAKLIKFVKQMAGGVVYDQSLQDEINADGKSQGSGSGEMTDDLTEDAIAFILKSKQASVSMLQRRFRIGYNRAARIIDEIEEMGIIGPSDGSRPRQVLVTEEEYYGGGEEVEAELVTEDVPTDEPEYIKGRTVQFEYINNPEDPDDDIVTSKVGVDTGVHAFDSLPESVQKELLNTDD